MLAQPVLPEAFRTVPSPPAIAEKKGLRSVSDDATLKPLVDEIVAAKPQAIADFRAGKERALGALVGQVMKKTGGKADAAIVQKLIRDAMAKG